MRERGDVSEEEREEEGKKLDFRRVTMRETEREEIHTENRSMDRSE